jgi:hypothetical protein
LEIFPAFGDYSKKKKKSEGLSLGRFIEDGFSLVFYDKKKICLVKEINWFLR